MSSPSQEKMGSSSNEVLGFREPTDGSLRYRPYGSMPANPFADEQIKSRQFEIRQEFLKLYGQTEGIVPDGVAAMMLADFTINEERRSMKNFESYMQWLDINEQVSQEVQENLAYYERGAALVDELSGIALGTSIESIEFGKVTHPYWRRIEHVKALREDVVSSIESRAGVVYPTIIPYRDIKIHPYTSDHTGVEGIVGNLQGFIVSYKRDIGYMPTNNPMAVFRNVERQIAGFRIDAESDFPQDKIDKFINSRGLQHDKNSAEFDFHLRNSGVRGFIEKSIQLDVTDDYILPQSTTIFGYRDVRRPEELPNRFDIARVTNIGKHGLALIHNQNLLNKVA